MANKIKTTQPDNAGLDDGRQWQEMTPIERRGDIWIKRDDLYQQAGQRGGKVRTCWTLAQGASGLVTAGSRMSPQCNIVASVAAALGIPCQVHTPTGKLGPEVAEAQRKGAEVVQHRAGYNTVIVARAREAAQKLGWTEIPFGMECATAVQATSRQVSALPPAVRRIIVPVGSGMSLAGILHGLKRQGIDIEVIGVQVGADPTKRLDLYAPQDWRRRVRLIPAGVDYHRAVNVILSGVRLDPIYEAKCAKFLQPDDLLWCVGLRQTVADQTATEVEQNYAMIKDNDEIKHAAKSGVKPGGLLKMSDSNAKYMYAKNKYRKGETIDVEAIKAQHPETSGTSIFDPVLCELAYRWFSPPAGRVLDPFAGGSVRGIVAAILGRQYTGIDLRGEQIAANEEQAAAICKEVMPVWITGDSLRLAELLPEDYAADFIFSCPPYGDLETYSDDPDDLSTMEYDTFITAYRAIIAAAVAKLAPNRFACFVVGDFRDKKGHYRGFPSATISAFEEAGARLYNEAVLVTAVGSLPIRAGRAFESGRKLGKTHQNVLVFVKGDARQATAACGPVVVNADLFSDE